MKLPAHQIVVKLAQRRELTLADIAQYLDIRFNDYRDWLPVAGLMKEGYISRVLVEKGAQHNEEKVLASFLYGMTLGPGTHEVNNATVVNSNREPSKEETVYLTAKGEMYLAGERAERNLRLWALLTSILVGSSSAILVLLFERYAYGS